MAIVEDGDAGILRSFSESPPFSYILKVESFSLLAEDSIKETNVICDSRVFGAGGYNWKLAIYPNGNKKKNVTDHISLYLVEAGEIPLQPGEEIHVEFRVFLLDQLKMKYLVVEDAFQRNFCFRGEMSGAVGFDRLISLRDFTDASNGYLIDDKCVFGAEVFVRNGRRVLRPDCLSIRKNISEKYKHTWKVVKFSELTAQYYEKRFAAGGYDWKIMLYPEGAGDGRGTHLSLYLGLADPNSFPKGTKILTKFSLSILDQIHGRHHTYRCPSTLLGATADGSWGQGWSRFIGLEYFRRASGGFLKTDTCFVQAELTVGTAMVLNTLGKNDTDIQEDANNIERFAKGSHTSSEKKALVFTCFAVASVPLALFLLYKTM